MATVCLVFFLTLPFLDLWLFRRHVRLQERGEHRMSYYGQLLLELWVPTAAVLTWLSVSDLSPRRIGLGWFRLEEGPFPRWLSSVVVALALAFILYCVVDLLRLRLSQAYRASVRKRLQSADLPSYVAAIMPMTDSQRTLYGALALSAGFTEELLYRGLLVFVLGAGFPAIGIWGSVLMSSALFALGHLYQGPSGMGRTFVMGLVMCLIYLSSGTLVLCMLIHALIDAVGVVLHSSSDHRPDPAGAQRQ